MIIKKLYKHYTYIDKYNRSLLKYTQYGNALTINECRNQYKCACSNSETYKLSKKYGLVKNKYTRSILQKKCQCKNYINALNILKTIKVWSSNTIMYYNKYIWYAQYGDSCELWEGEWNPRRKLNKLNKYDKKWSNKIEKYHPFLVIFAFSKIHFKITARMSRW